MCHSFRVGGQVQDTTRPGVELQTGNASVDGPFQLNITFTEPVLGLEPGDFSIANGSISNLSGTGASYTAQVTPLQEGVVSISLSVNVTTDAAGNANLPSNVLTVNFDVPDDTSGECDGARNLAVDGTATQSSVIFGAEAGRAKDGNLNGSFNDGSVTATAFEFQAWWELDLGQVSDIEWVNVWNRTDNRIDRLSKFYVLVSETPFVSSNLNAVLEQPEVFQSYHPGQGESPSQFAVNRRGRYVRVQLLESEHLTLTEVEVMGCPAGEDPIVTDSERPGVSLYTNRDQVEGSFLVSAFFTEPVEGFALADIQIENGFPSSLAGQGNEYRFFVTPEAQGPVRVTLPENKVNDAAGNGNWTSNEVLVQFGMENDPTVASAYCKAVADAPNQEWIGKVKLGGYSNSSTLEGYGDFTDQVIALSAGTAFPIELRADYAGGAREVFWRVWIDLNQNNSFDDVGELVFSSQFANTITGIVWIPTNASSGTTRMRVVMGGEYYGDACGNFDRGEVEDYTVEISGGSSIRESLYFLAEATQRNVRLNWASNQGFRTSHFEVEYSVDGQQFEVIHREDNAQFSNELLEFSALHRSPVSGANYYRLKLHYLDGTFIFTRPELVQFDMDLQSFRVYPNPTQQDVYINVRNFAGSRGQIKIYDLLGRVIFEERYDELPDYPIHLTLEGITGS
ncbi:MAG: Ig-like domain-containing protein [Bacteroidota bacterium]